MLKRMLKVLRLKFIQKNVILSWERAGVSAISGLLIQTKREFIFVSVIILLQLLHST